jgi:hypothetical protein
VTESAPAAVNEQVERRSAVGSREAPDLDRATWKQTMAETHDKGT